MVGSHDDIAEEVALNKEQVVDWRDANHRLKIGGSSTGGFGRTRLSREEQVEEQVEEEEFIDKRRCYEQGALLGLRCLQASTSPSRS